MTLDLRASGMPLAFLCPGSARPATLPINEDMAAGRLGSAVHEALRTLAETGSVPWASIPEIAARHLVGVEEVRILCGQAANLWPTLAPSFPDAMTEVPLSANFIGRNGEQIHLTGHADLLSVRGTVARLGDWKTGRIDVDHGQQMRAYAALALLENTDLTEVTVTVIWIRDGEIENYTMRADGLSSWTRELIERVAEWDGTFRPGRHCTRCHRSHDCEAATAMARRDVAIIADRAMVARAEAELSTMAPADIVELRRKADLVKRYAYRVEDAIKAHVLANGDVVADGVRLTIDTIEKRELDTAAAWGVLESAGFDDKDFADTVSIPISKVEKRVAEKAGRGNGAAAVRELKTKLEAAGAVLTKETHLLKEKRT
jgi:hypothetical protein